MSLEAHSWGISDTQFLTAFVLVCGLYVLAAGLLARFHTGRPPSSALDEPADSYELAMLTDGSVCVATAAAARLHQAGALRVEDGQLFATGDDVAAANPVERELVQTLRKGAGTSAEELRQTLAGGPLHARMAVKLADCGLLRAPGRTSAVLRLQRLAWALTAIGSVRFVWAAVDPPDGPMSGAAVASFVIGLGLPSIVYIVSGREAPGVTPEGRRLLARERKRHRKLSVGSVSGDQIALAVALFGSEPLRRADPELATAWGILSPDEAEVQTALLG